MFFVIWPVVVGLDVVCPLCWAFVFLDTGRRKFVGWGLGSVHAHWVIAYDVKYAV